MSLHALRHALAVMPLLAFASTAAAQGTHADYVRAERFLPASADTLLQRVAGPPRWIRGGDRFWYRVDHGRRRAYVLVDPAANVQRPAFDHARLAAALAAALGRPFHADSLQVDSLAFSAMLDSADVRLGRDAARCSLAGYACTRLPVDTTSRAGRSPDGRWVAFARDWNLWVRSTETGAERQLTTDGARDWAYGLPVTGVWTMLAQGTETPDDEVRVTWSPDSRRLITYRTDTRRAGRLSMTQFMPPGGYGTRPRTFAYVYPLVGDSVLPTAAPVLWEVEGWRRTDARMPPIEHMSYGGGPGFRWSPDGTRAWVGQPTRDYTALRLYEIVAGTGAVRTVVEERDSTYVDSYYSIGWWLDLAGRNTVLWTSPRDGWNHLYAYDATTGAVRRQLTRGSFVVTRVNAVDTTRDVAFVEALGREPGRDPYLAHVYAVDLAGRRPMRLLTPEPANHAASFSPSRRWLVDTYSRVDQPPVTVLRRASDGVVVRELERADATRLLATGWKAPEQFTVTARDGRTPLHGVIWKPTSFDAGRRYPVIEQTYTGPQSFYVPKTFAAYRNHAQAIAELGFVVVMLDGTGTAGRSRAFHAASHRNLGGGLADHPGAIRQLAATRPWMDTTRVGVFGHSAGGYDAARAILQYPEFYKVAVASAGDHDARLDKAVWNAQWMGYERGEHFAAQSNARLAGNLRGRLLLAHGDIDDNVPMVATMQLVDALVREHKDFDLLIVPGATHALGSMPYFQRRRWDYFVRHLLGVEPPRDYRIGAPPPARPLP